MGSNDLSVGRCYLIPRSVADDMAKALAKMTYGVERMNPLLGNKYIYQTEIDCANESLANYKKAIGE